LKLCDVCLYELSLLFLLNYSKTKYKNINYSIIPIAKSKQERANYVQIRLLGNSVIY